MLQGIPVEPVVPGLLLVASMGGAQSRSEIGNRELCSLVHALPPNFMIPVPRYMDYHSCQATYKPLPCNECTTLPTLHLKLGQFPPRVLEVVRCCSACSDYGHCIVRIVSRKGLWLWECFGFRESILGAGMHFSFGPMHQRKENRGVARKVGML